MLKTTTKYNYYSFGSLQSGQSYQSGKSRYGFNGMEMDNELGITGKDYTTEFREYNADVGRWWSPDLKSVASESWYVCMGIKINLINLSQ